MGVETMVIKFHRRNAGHYRATVNGIMYELIGPDPCYPPEDPGYAWTLESDNSVEYFRTLHDARKFLEAREV